MTEKFRELIRKYVPEKSVNYCVDIWVSYPFSFKVTRQRTSKIGDYRYNQKTGNHEITVNGNLNIYAFLITFFHEVAHLLQYRKYQNNRPPHGIAWKNIFQELMGPVLNEDIFPPDILEPLKKHMKNPKASSQSDPVLSKLLRQYDRHIPGENFYLEELSEGATFSLDGRVYTKIKKRRTRSLCRESKTGRKFLISEIAQVKKLQ